MNRSSVTVLLSAVALSVPQHAVGQTLAELAKQEAARRQTTTTATKVITNADLKPVPPPSSGTPTTPAPGTTLPPPPPLPKDAAAQSESKPGAGDGAKKDESSVANEKKDEKYWRGRITTARDGLARSETFQQALQARIAALSTDFVNRDDPAQRAAVATDRLKAMGELERVKQDIAGYQAELTKIADEARRAGVPAGWVR